MAQHNRSRAKRIAIDVLGFGAIIAAALTGWLPGPGGIPLLIIGLSLLATNHAWAERLLMTVKHRSSSLADQFFDGHPTLKLAVDVAGIALIAVVVYILTHFTGSIAWSAAISLSAISIFVLLSNRRRLQWLRNRLRRSEP